MAEGGTNLKILQNAISSDFIAIFLQQTNLISFSVRSMEFQYLAHLSIITHGFCVMESDLKSNHIVVGFSYIVCATILPTKTPLIDNAVLPASFQIFLITRIMNYGLLSNKEVQNITYIVYCLEFTCLVDMVVVKHEIIISSKIN